jgi:hypothetical protein
MNEEYGAYVQEKVLAFFFGISMSDDCICAIERTGSGARQQCGSWGQNQQQRRENEGSQIRSDFHSPR